MAENSLNDQPLFVRPIEPSGLSEFDQDMLDPDPRVVNGAIRTEISRRLAHIGKAHITPFDQAAEVDESFRLMLEYQGGPDEVFEAQKQALRDIARKVGTRKDLEPFVFDSSLDDILDACVSLDQAVELIEAVRGTEHIGQRYIYKCEERLSKLNYLERLPYVKKLKDSTGHVSWLAGKTSGDLVRNTEGLDDASRHTRFEQALELLDGLDPRDDHFSYKALIDSCPPEYLDVRKSIQKRYVDSLQSKGFDRSVAFTCERLTRDLARDDPLFVAGQMPDLARLLNQSQDESLFLFWLDCFDLMKRCVTRLDPRVPQERAAIGKLGYISCALAKGDEIGIFDELADVSAEDIRDLKQLGSIPLFLSSATEMI